MTTKTVETETIKVDVLTGKQIFGWGPIPADQQVREEVIEHTVVTGTVIARQIGTLTSQTITLDDGVVYHVTGVLPAVGSTVTGREQIIPSGLLLGRVRIH